MKLNVINLWKTQLKTIILEITVINTKKIQILLSLKIQILQKKIIDFLKLNNNQKNKLGFNARKYYLKQFDLNLLINKLLKIFDNEWYFY